MPSTTTVTVGWTHEDEDFRVELEVTAGSPEIRWGDNACPADPGEVTVVTVHEDSPGGRERRDLIAAAEADIESLEEQGFEAAAEASEPDPDDEWDRRREDEYERRHG